MAVSLADAGSLHERLERRGTGQRTILERPRSSLLIRLEYDVNVGIGIPHRSTGPGGRLLPVPPRQWWIPSPAPPPSHRVNEALDRIVVRDDPAYTQVWTAVVAPCRSVSGPLDRRRTGHHRPL